MGTTEMKKPRASFETRCDRIARSGTTKHRANEKRQIWRTAKTRRVVTRDASCNRGQLSKAAWKTRLREVYESSDIRVDITNWIGRWKCVDDEKQEESVGRELNGRYGAREVAVRARLKYVGACRETPNVCRTERKWNGNHARRVRKSHAYVPGRKFYGHAICYRTCKSVVGHEFRVG